MLCRSRNFQTSDSSVVHRKVIAQLLMHLLDYIWYCHFHLSNLFTCNCKYKQFVIMKSNHDYDSFCNVIKNSVLILYVGSSGRAVERQTGNQGDSGSNRPTAISKLRQFRSPHIYLSLSEESEMMKAAEHDYSVLCPVHTGSDERRRVSTPRHRQKQLRSTTIV